MQTESLLAEILSQRKSLTNVRAIDRDVRRALREMRHTIVKGAAHTFKPVGATLVYILRESHLVLHTYPESAKVSLDMNLCGGDIMALYETMLRIFSATDHEYYRFTRATGASCGVITPVGKLYQYRIADGITLAYDAESVIFDDRTKFQHISIIRNQSCGLALFLDGYLQFCDADRNFYAQLMTGPVIARRPSHVLILGGGEGQVAKYLLENSTVERVTIVELDPEAVEIYRTHFVGVNEVLADRRVGLLIADAFDYVARQASAKASFDGVVLDLTQWPIGMSYEQYYGSFLGNVAKISRLVTFFSTGPLEKGRLISQARPLGQGHLRRRFRELGFKAHFRRVVHPVWGSICTFGYAEKARGTEGKTGSKLVRVRERM